MLFWLTHVLLTLCHCDSIFVSMLRALPNFLTLLNLIAGSCAIAALFGGHPAVTLFLAALCLVFDVFDGLLARRLQVTSALGVQLDSLADLVSFGLLPACILFTFLNAGCSQLFQSVLPYGAFLVAGAAGLRLARFNVDTRTRETFYGLPSPSAAVSIFGLLLMQVTNHPWWDGMCHALPLYGLVLLLSLLMLSNLRLWSLKGMGDRRGRLIFGILAGLGIILLLLTGAAGFSLMVGIYVLFGIVNLFLNVY